MSLHDVNISLFKLVASVRPAHKSDLQALLRGMSDAEAFTFLRMAHECKAENPVTLLQRLRANSGWEKHCDLAWQERTIEYYTTAFQKKKAA